MGLFGCEHSVLKLYDQTLTRDISHAEIDRYFEADYAVEGGCSRGLETDRLQHRDGCLPRHDRKRVGPRPSAHDLSEGKGSTHSRTDLLDPARLKNFGVHTGDRTADIPTTFTFTIEPW